MIIIKEKQDLNEMARVCQKSDGFGIIIEIYSNDHGIIGNQQSPAHAHVFDINMNEIGEIVLVKKVPQKPSDIIWYRSTPPETYTNKVLKWARGSKYSTNNWVVAIRIWEGFHPS